MSDALRLLKAELEKAGWPFEELLDHAEATPQWWAELAPGKALQRLRWKNRLTQSELGRRAGIGQSHVARIESGKDCRLATLWRLFTALGYKPVIVAALDGANPRVDPRKQPSPWTNYLEEQQKRSA